MGIATLFTQTVSVKTFTQSGSFGPTYADPVDVACFVNDGRKLVRDPSGDQVVSETTLYAPLAAADVFTDGSKVDVNGRTATVICAYRRDSAGPASAHHTQVTLT